MALVKASNGPIPDNRTKELPAGAGFVDYVFEFFGNPEGEDVGLPSAAYEVA